MSPAALKQLGMCLTPHECGKSNVPSMKLLPPIPVLTSYRLVERDGRILCTSAMKSLKTAAWKSSTMKRPYLADKKGALAHLQPKSLAISSVRVTFVQGASAVTSFLGEQLEVELEREERVADGSISREEADKEAEQWEHQEMQARKKAFPRRALIALLKFHAATLIMRFLEHVALQIFSERTVDKLTKDPYLSARRKADRCDSRHTADGTLTRTDRIEVGRLMFKTSLYANAIAYMADYAVQQGVLAWGYGSYVLARRRRKNDAAKDKKNSQPQPHLPENSNGGGLVLSFALRSSSLAVSRATALVVSCAGASVGTMLWPGWGTILGTQVGDGVAGALLDPLTSPSSS